MLPPPPYSCGLVSVLSDWSTICYSKRQTDPIFRSIANPYTEVFFAAAVQLDSSSLHFQTCAIIFATKASPTKMKVKMIVPCRRSHSNPAKTLPPNFINDGVFSHKTPFWQKIMVSMKLMVDLTLSHVYRGKYIFETVFTWSSKPNHHWNANT